MRKSRQMLRFIALLFLVCGLGRSQGPDADYFEFAALSTVTSTAAHNVGLGGGASAFPTFHTLQLENVGTPATCTVQLEGCVNDPTDTACWEILSAPNVNCITTKMFHVISRPVRHVRANLTALTGTAATVLAVAETLSDTGFPDGTNWDEVGDFATPAGTAVYTHSGGTGTMTQLSGNLNTAGVASAHYAATYQVVSQSGDTACIITTTFAASAVDLDETVSTNTTFFTSAAVPGDFIISCTSTSGAITFDDFTITKQNCSVESPINVTTTAAHGYSTGAQVTITGAVGNTACNVTDNLITVIDTTHFTLDGTTGTVKWTGSGSITSDPRIVGHYLGVR